ncbi:MAG: hypothetical protein BZY79_04225 [SAR202 cluster bacterium Casp-Chloro-G4]|nr:MAG: hypothetical protein BZY79_04225 [SAR202 cluster bacterium Casp-Chloro-G4]
MPTGPSYCSRSGKAGSRSRGFSLCGMTTAGITVGGGEGVGADVGANSGLSGIATTVGGSVGAALTETAGRGSGAISGLEEQPTATTITTIKGKKNLMEQL